MREADREGPPRGVLRGLIRRPEFALGIALVVFAAISFYLSVLRAEELQTTTWDMGIFQQALWSADHGRNFYEAADLETGGYHSLLQVHSVFLLYALAPVYGALPQQGTLFAVQTAVVAFAAVPLYLLGRDAGRSPTLGFVAALTYLAWAGTLSSALYDFHAEAFLPLEFLSVFYLWYRGRFALGLAVAAIGFLTIEIAPVLLFFLGLYGISESLEPPAPERAPARAPHFSALFERLRVWRSPRGRASLALAAASVVAYSVLLWVRTDLLASVLGTTELVQGSAGYLIGGSPAALGLAGSQLGVDLGGKLVYWLLLLGLLGFIPFVAPRALALSAPWFVFTLFSANTNFTELGWQYGFIAAGPLLAAFALGLPRLARWAQTTGSASVPGRTEGRGTGARRPWPRGRPGALAVAWVLLLAVNLLLTPADPLVQNNGWGAAYRVEYVPPPGYAGAQALAALVPPTAPVLATDNLFPLVANDPNAYSLLWQSDPVLALPFDGTHLPEFVLLAENRTYAVPPWLTLELYDPSAYGVRGVVWSTIAGTLLLFEAGYRGPYSQWGGAPPVLGTFPARALVNDEAGLLVPFNGTADGEAAINPLGALGTIWWGPRVSLAPGNYSVEVRLRADPAAGFAPPRANDTVVWIGASAYAIPPFYGFANRYSELSAPGWSTVEFRIDVPAPAIQFSVQGVALAPGARITLDSVQILAVP
jgi:uncharacterized membrane protein